MSGRTIERLALASLAALAALSTTPALAATGTASASASTSASASKLTSRIASHHVLVGGSVRVNGRAGAPYGTIVRLQVRRGGAWRTVDRVHAGRQGRYRLLWRPRSTGSRALRVLAAGDSRDSGRVAVYRRALASWFGPGLFGSALACGGHLTARTLGVANKTLPCGTKLRLRYRGRSVTVRVIDRGPYVGAREFDLTAALRARLRFDGVGTILTTR